MKVLELYKITLGEASYFWSNGDEPIDHDGDTYEPITIGRTQITQNNEINRANIRLTIPFDNELAQVYLSDSPDVLASVTVFRVEGETVLTYWKGRVASSRTTGQQTTLECDSVFTGMRRTGARARYQRQCRHALYGTACGVDKAAFAVNGTVTAVEGKIVTITPDFDLEEGEDPPAAGYFIGGMLERNGVLRFIVGESGTNFTLWREMPDIEVDDSVLLYPGCDRTLATCTNRFENTLNFGGFPWLPGDNPFDFKNVF